MIQVRDLGYQVGQKSLLTGVSFDLPPGEVLALLGPNGAGKSTLLKCLSGQIEKPQGVIRIGEKLLSSMHPRDLAKWRAVLPQSKHTPFDFTAMEIVLLGRSPHLQGSESSKDHEIARAALTETDAIHLKDRTVNTLSGGEMQRVHLARILAQIWEPIPEYERLLLLDEPTTGLDLHHQHALLKTARAWAAKGTAVMVILHDLNLAAAYADRILILKQGRVVIANHPREVLTSERIAEVFQIRVSLLNHPLEKHPLIVVHPTP